MEQKTLLQKRLLERKRQEQEIDQKVEREQLTPTMDERTAIDILIKTISRKFRDRLNDPAANREQLNTDISEAIRKEVEMLKVDYEQKARLEKLALTSIVGYGPIQRYLEDDTITEIIVQRFDNICVEKEGSILSTTASFTDEQNLRNVIDRILQPVGRVVNMRQPIVDARLPDGSRINATIPPVSPYGATLTIRKFNNKMMTPQKYLELKSLDQNILDFLKLCVIGKISIFVSGGTGTGKTTFLNMLSEFLPNNELIITIEDTLELQLKQKNVRSFETKQINPGDSDMMVVDMSALVKAALRQRPDRIILGETRDGAVVSLLTAMSTGHEGSLSTGHANSPYNLIAARIPQMIEMDPTTSFTERAQTIMISEALQLIVQLRKLPNKRRVVWEITEVDGIDEKGAIRLHDIFKYDMKTETFHYTGHFPKNIAEKLAYNGIDLKQAFFEKK